MQIKCLSVKLPWAALIADGTKRVQEAIDHAIKELGRIESEKKPRHDYTNGCCTALEEGHRWNREKNWRPKT